jgi:hypothetical protein
MINDFIYYWKNYDLKTAWWVLLYGDQWIEELQDLEMWIDENESNPFTITFQRFNTADDAKAARANTYKFD